MPLKCTFLVKSCLFGWQSFKTWRNSVIQWSIFRPSRRAQKVCARKVMHEHWQVQKNVSGVLKICLQAEGLPPEPVDEAESYLTRYPLAGRWYTNNVEMIHTLP